MGNHEPRSSTNLYFDNLDALRFLAAFAVICSHLVGWFHFPENVTGKIIRIILSWDGEGGNAGVSFFFVLSGFLITYLILHEHHQNKAFNIRNFYIRRFLRIWPLYFLSLVIGFLIYPLVTTTVHFQEAVDWKMYALFLTNFENIYQGYPSVGILGVQWSVAIEEQFYLFWPLFFLFVRSKDKFYRVCLLFILISFAARLAGLHRYHTLIAINDLAMGGWIACFAFYHLDRLTGWLSKISKQRIILIYGVGLLLLLFNFQLNKRLPVYGYFDRVIHSVFFSFIILEQNYSPHSFFKLGSVVIFTELGKISYGLYLLHMVAIYLVLGLDRVHELNILTNSILALLLSLLLSTLSYRFFESYFLRLKDKFASVTTHLN